MSDLISDKEHARMQAVMDEFCAEVLEQLKELERNPPPESHEDRVFRELRERGFMSTWTWNDDGSWGARIVPRREIPWSETIMLPPQIVDQIRQDALTKAETKLAELRLQDNMPKSRRKKNRGGPYDWTF